MLRAAKAVLVIFTFGFLLSCGSVPAKPAKANQQPAVAEEEKKRQSQDSGIVPPEIVRSKNVRVAFGLKTVRVGNTNGEYVLSCNLKATSGCISPTPSKNYLLFNKNTRWKMPGAKEFITLALVQDWTVSYNQGENIGLVPQEADGAGPEGMGMYTLDSWTASR